VSAHVCSRMLMYAHVCSRMLTHAHVCSRMLTYAYRAFEVDSDDTDMLHAHANHTPAGGGVSRSGGEAASYSLLPSMTHHTHKHSSVVPWTSTSRSRHVADAHVQARFERYGLGHVCAGFTTQFTCFASTKIQTLTPQLQMYAATSA